MKSIEKKTLTSGRSIRPGVLFFLTAVLTFSACNDGPPPATPVASCDASKKDTATSGQGAGLRLAEDTKVDFVKDILPILSSSRDDEVYKCTSCHSAYTKEETFADKGKLDTIIDQVETLKMPLNGDEMRKDQIDLIKKWRDQKFPADGEKPIVGPTEPDSKIDWEEQDRQKNEAKKPSSPTTSKPTSGCSKS